MAEKKRRKKYNETEKAPEDEAPSKDEYAVAKWLSNNVPTKRTKLTDHYVEYFTSSKALDSLMSSKWAEGTNPLFPSRERAINFLNTMLLHKFFHRAIKAPVTEQELRGRKKGEEKNKGYTNKNGLKDMKSMEKPQELQRADAENRQVDEKDNTLAVQGKEKRKRKIRLEIHLEQVFVDGADAYVWIYEPIPIHYWLYGGLLLFGVIGICLYPLWPPTVRQGAYYISLCAAGFLVFIIILAILRSAVFCLVAIVTLGNHHLWLFPNLAEDVGFFASFWPLYVHEYKGGESLKKTNKKKKKRKEKYSDNEGDPKVSEINVTEVEENDLFKEMIDVKPPDPSENGSESSQRSSTGRDFEMVDAS